MLYKNVWRSHEYSPANLPDLDIPSSFRKSARVAAGDVPGSSASSAGLGGAGGKVVERPSRLCDKLLMDRFMSGDRVIALRLRHTPLSILLKHARLLRSVDYQNNIDAGPKLRCQDYFLKMLANLARCYLSSVSHARTSL